MEMTPGATFGIVGAGWRVDAYLRIARELPDLFSVSAVVARDPVKAERLRKAFGVRTVATTEELIALKPDFAVTSVSWTANPGVVRALAGADIPVLSETPPAANVALMTEMADLIAKGWRVQVAEQVALRPAYLAAKALIASGALGEVSEVQASVAHGYHGVSTIEELLGVARQRPKIRAMRFKAPIVKGPDRDGDPASESVVEGTQTLAWMEYPDGRLGVFDFTGDQYFATIRDSRLLVRGARGEMDLREARWLAAFDAPVRAPFVRRRLGEGDDLSGMGPERITLGERMLWTNPHPQARLSDDELAIARMMVAMANGEEIYPLARAMHDHAVGIAIDQAASSGETVEVPAGPWSREG